MLLLASTALLLAARRWRLAMLPAALAALNLSIVLPVYWGGGDHTASGHTYRLVSANIEASNTHAGEGARPRPAGGPGRPHPPGVHAALDGAAPRPGGRATPCTCCCRTTTTSASASTAACRWSTGSRWRRSIPTCGACARASTRTAGPSPSSPSTPPRRSAARPAGCATANCVSLPNWPPAPRRPLILAGDLNTSPYSPHFADLLQAQPPARQPPRLRHRAHLAGPPLAPAHPHRPLPRHPRRAHRRPPRRPSHRQRSPADRG